KRDWSSDVCSSDLLTATDKPYSASLGWATTTSTRSISSTFSSSRSVTSHHAKGCSSTLCLSIPPWPRLWECSFRHMTLCCYEFKAKVKRSNKLVCLSD